MGIGALVLATAQGKAQEKLEAEVILEYFPDDDTHVFTDIKRYRNPKNGKVSVKGVNTTPRCRPLVCIADDPKPCGVYNNFDDPNYYFDAQAEAGGTCCLVNEENDPDCQKPQQCGENCAPGACIPTEEGCRTAACYECDDTFGDVYGIADIQTKPICLKVGTKEAGPNPNVERDLPERTVALTCGVHELPFFGAVEENRDIGQVECMFFRKPTVEGELTNVDDGLNTGAFPCVFLQLLFCGCGPADMFTFGLLAPKFPCRPGEDLPTCPLTVFEGYIFEFEGAVADQPCNCPIICEDVPGRKAEVCDSFDFIGERLEAAGYLAPGFADGFDLFEAFTQPEGFGSGEADRYEINIY